MQGKTCVITGATSGIGRAAAIALAERGARIVMVARDQRRAEQALDDLSAVSPRTSHGVHYGDLSLLSEMKRVAAEIAAAEPRVDVLINNAGVLFSFRKCTADGFERTFAINHLAYFVLTLGLRERLIAAAPARVINTASAMHKRARLDFDDLQFERAFNGVSAYERSKLCNVLFTRELARRWRDQRVTANALHPGLVRSRFGNRSGGLVPAMFGAMKLVFGISARRGASTIEYLATSPDVANVTGRYFEKCREVLPGANAENDDDARRLWAETAKLTGIG